MTAALVGCGGGGDAASTDPSVGGSSGAVGTSPASAWLDPHNALRAGTFTGVTLDPMPSPALPALTWSASAEAVARAWAEGCSYGHNPGRSADGVARGENIAATAPAGRADATPAWIVGQWGNESADYDYPSNTCAAGQVCGHYTQLVWRATMRVGCARATCTVNSPFGASQPTWDYFVCDYEPPGNIVGRQPY